MESMEQKISHEKNKKTPWITRFCRRLRKSQAGAGVVEYALIAIVVLLVIGPALYFASGAIANRVKWVGIWIQDGKPAADAWLEAQKLGVPQTDLGHGGQNTPGVQ